MECRVWRMWSVECGVWSVKCGVESVECKVWSVKGGLGRVKCIVWSVECRVWSVECRARNATRLMCCACHATWQWRSPKCGACHENCNSSCENDAKYCACDTKRLSTRYQTGWNVTKCHACHAKRHDNLLGNLRNRIGSAACPHRHGGATGKPETRDETRWSIKTSISCDTPSNFHTLFVASNSAFSYEFSYEPPNLLPQNRCFVRSFHQFS